MEWAPKKFYSVSAGALKTNGPPIAKEKIMGSKNENVKSFLCSAFTTEKAGMVHH